MSGRLRASCPSRSPPGSKARPRVRRRLLGCRPKVPGGSEILSILVSSKTRQIFSRDRKAKKYEDRRIRRRLASVVLGVAGREGVPLFRQVVEGKDRRNRTHRNAGAAVDAFDRVDV